MDCLQADQNISILFHTFSLISVLIDNQYDSNFSNYSGTTIQDIFQNTMCVHRPARFVGIHHPYFQIQKRFHAKTSNAQE
jgi:hypothetical protein